MWYLAAKLSIQRPEYVSTECDIESNPAAIVTSYRILVSSVVAILGTIKATMSFYSNIPTTAAIWFEWFFAGLVLSV